MPLKSLDILQDLQCFVYSATNDNGKWVTQFVGEWINHITGHKAEDFTINRLDWLELIHPEDLERVKVEAETLNTPPQELIQEYRIIHKNGSVFWVRDTKRSQIINGNFQVKGIVVDITSSKLLELKNIELMNSLISKNNQLQNALSSIQALSTQIQNETNIIRETIGLRIQKDVLPLFNKINPKNYKEMIELIEKLLSQTLTSIPTFKVGKILTKKEMEIASRVLEGITQIEIAKELSVSLDTVKSHVKNIKKKLNVTNKESLFTALKRSKADGTLDL